MFSLLSRRNASTSAYDAVLKRAGIKIPIKPKKEELGPAIIRKSRSVLPTEPPPSSTVPRDNLRFDAEWWKKDLETFFRTPKRVIVNLTDDSAEMPLSTVLQYLHDGLRDDRWNVYKKFLSLCSSRAYTSQKSDFDQFILTFIVKDVVREDKMRDLQQSRILAVFSEMKRHGHEPDATTFTYIITAFNNNLRFLGKIHNHIMNRIVEEKATGNPFSEIVSEVTMRSLLAGYHRSKNPAKYEYIDRLWFDIREANVQMSHQLGIGFIHAFQSMIPDPKGMAGLMRVHKVLEQRHTVNPWPRHVGDALMEAYSFTNSHVAVKKLFEIQEEKYSLVTENYKACMRVQTDTNYSPESILYFADTMSKKQDVPKDDDVFRMVLDACVDVRDRGLIRTKCHSQFYLYTTACKEAAMVMPRRIMDLSKPFKPLFPSATPFTFFRIITAFCKLGDLRGGLRALDQWYETRTWIHEYLATAAPDVIQKPHVVFTPPPAMFPLRALARAHGVCFSMDLDFFRDHVFDHACIQLQWRRKRDTRRKEIMDKIEVEQMELRDAIRKRKSDSKIKRTIASLHHHLNEDVKINPGDLGEDGPFGSIYTSFSRGFLQKVDHLSEIKRDLIDSIENPPDEEEAEWDTSVNARIVDQRLLDTYYAQGFEELAIELRDFLVRVREVERGCVEAFLNGGVTGEREEVPEYWPVEVEEEIVAVVDEFEKDKDGVVEL